MFGLRVRPRGCGILFPHSRAKARRGVTLIEAVLFISVALGIIVGGLVVFEQAQTASRTQATMRLTRALVVEARALMQVSPGELVDRIDSVLIASGAVPAGAVDRARGRITSVWGGDILVFPWTRATHAGVTAQSALQVSFSEIPREICSRLIAFDSSGSGTLADGVEFVLIGSGFHFSDIGVGRWPGLAAGAPTGPLTPSAAAEMCRAAAGSDGMVTPFAVFFAWFT